jgi:pyruvate/2-oxoglutarate dehydrogenase complex dihydrolipoamide acyltransferase (E2) component
MNDHDEIRTKLAAYCGDDLGTAERRRVEEHLAVCEACRAELGDLQTALHLIRTTPEAEPPPWLAARIMARIREQQRKKRSWLRLFFFPLHVKLPFEVAALLLVCVSGYYMARTVETELQRPVSREETVAAPPQTGTHPDARRQMAPMAPMAPAAPSPAAPAPSTPPAAVDRSGADPEGPTPSQPAPKAVEQAAPQQRLEYHGTPSPTQNFAPAPRVMKEERSMPAAEPMPDNIPAIRYVPGERAAKKAKKAASPPEAWRRDSTGAETTSETAGARPELNRPLVRIRMTFANPAEAATTLREMVIRSGGSLDDEHPLQPNTLKARLPASRLREFLTRLERIGRIIDRPQPPDTTGSINMEIRW